MVGRGLDEGVVVVEGVDMLVIEEEEVGVGGRSRSLGID